MLDIQQDTHEISQPPQDANSGPIIFCPTMRAFSVPANLPEIAHEFMDRLQVNNQINGDDSAMEIYPSKHRDRSGDSYPVSSSEDETEDDDSANFFLPFDDDIAESVEETRIPPSEPVECRHEILNARLLEPNVMEEKPAQHQPREAAMACLEEFFFGGTLPAVETEIQTSPASVLDLRNRQVHNEIPACSKTKQPASASSLPKTRNMFGHVIQEECPAVTPIASQPSHEVDPSTTQHEFTMLHSYDRSKSVPTGMNLMEISPTTRLTRKSSMKKFSSISNFATLKPTVSFSNLEIREYDVAISDHPSCSFGPPVQLSWEYKQKEVVPVESYEQSRSPRRGRRDLVLSYYDRRFLLIKQAGYSKREIKKTMLEVERVKRERLVTDLLLPASCLDETMETVLNTVKKLFAPRTAKCA